MKQIDFFLIRSESGLREAAKLVFEEYKVDGYIEPGKNDQSAEISRYNLLPTSATILTRCDGEALATVTVVGDGKLGLPMDSIYKSEVDSLRNKKLVIAEISQLAVKRNSAQGERIAQKLGKLFSPLSLFRIIFYYAESRGINTFGITVNPKHDKFYESLGFYALGEEKAYAAVNGAPALAKVLDLEAAISESGRQNVLFREILKNPLENSVFEGDGDIKLFSVDIDC